MAAKLLAFTLASLLLAWLPACNSAPDDEAAIRALVQRNVKAINAADQDTQWRTLCPSLRDRIGESNFRAAMRVLYAGGPVEARNLRFESVDLQAGQVRYSIDVKGNDTAHHFVETYAVA